MGSHCVVRQRNDYNQPRTACEVNSSWREASQEICHNHIAQGYSNRYTLHLSLFRCVYGRVQPHTSCKPGSWEKAKGCHDHMVSGLSIRHPRYPVSLQEGESTGMRFHTATALAAPNDVSATGHWIAKADHPDWYCCKETPPGGEQACLYCGWWISCTTCAPSFCYKLH